MHIFFQDRLGTNIGKVEKRVAFFAGTASTIPAWNNISSNFFLANYNPSLAIDNDDGSSFWQHHRNFIVYGQAGEFLSVDHHLSCSASQMMILKRCHDNSNSGNGGMRGGH